MFWVVASRIVRQRLKSMFFEKISHSAGPFRAALFKKFSNNVDFSLWANSVFRLSSVTLVLRHYCNTVTMTLVSWCRNTKVTLHQIWYTLKYHQFCSKFEKKAFFIGSNLKNHHFPPKIWKNHHCNQNLKNIILS